MKITKTHLRRIIREEYTRIKAMRESVFKSKDPAMGPGLSAGDGRYYDLARAYHQQGGTTIGGRTLGTVPSDKQEAIRAIEHCREWTQNYVEEKDTTPPPASYSRWPDEYLSEFPNGNITKRHLYFVCDWCRREVMGYASSLLDNIKNDKRYGR